jgi:hypothetical protein
MIRLFGSVTLAAATLAAAGSVSAQVPTDLAATVAADINVDIDVDVDFDTNFDFDFATEFLVPVGVRATHALNLQNPAPQAPPAPPAPPARSAPGARPVPAPAPAPPEPPTRVRVRTIDPERLINQALDDIGDGDFDDAIERLSAIISRFADASVAEATEKRVDAAMYWKAYAETKQRAMTEALATVEEMKKKFADSRWMKDAMALAVEVQQSVGQNVSPDSQPDEELKLLALRGLMQSDPDRAVPMIEQLLAGNSSVKVKENALFVLSQSRSPRAHEILANVARGRSNPDLQLRAIRYLGSNRNGDNLTILEEAYRNAGDERVKRAIIRSFTQAGDRTRLAVIANDANTSATLRGEAIQQLGVLHADDELVRMYGRESNPQIKQRITQGLFISGNAGALVTLAKAERDPGMKKDIVSKLSNMKSKEATDYLMELLK